MHNYKQKAEPRPSQSNVGGDRHMGTNAALCTHHARTGSVGLTGVDCPFEKK